MKRVFVLLILLTIAVVPLTTAYAQDAGVSLERLQSLNGSEPAPLLDDTSRGVVVARCAAAQTALLSTQKSIDKAVRARILIYSTIQKELKALELRMTKQGADASEIDLLIGKLQQELDTFSEKSRAYQQLSEDLVIIECANNPDVFAKGLTELRKTHKELQSSAEELHKIITSSPESTFNPLIDRLTI